MNIFLFTPSPLTANSLSFPLLLYSFLYLDPGTGSFVLQLVIASVMGGLLLVKVFWKKITGFFFRKQNKSIESDDDDFTEE